MAEPSLFDKIISELQTKLESSENYDQTLVDRVVVLLQKREFNSDDMIKLIESSTKKDATK